VPELLLEILSEETPARMQARAADDLKRLVCDGLNGAGLTFTGEGWEAATPNQIPATDITALRGTLEFTSGKGISPKKGAMGMSLQTPRVLTDDDLAALADAIGS